MNDLSKEYERIVLCRLMEEPSLYYDNHQLLSKNLFDDAIHRDIYSYIEGRINNGDGIVDSLSIVKALRGEYKDIVLELADITAYSLTPTDFKTAMLSLNEKKKFLELEQMVNSIHSMLQEKKDVFDIISEAQNRLGSISEVNTESIEEFSSHISKAIETIKDKMCGVDNFGITTGFKNLDSFTGGWQTTDLVIVGGASSMGKTSLAVSFAVNAAKDNKPTVIFSYEMGVQQLVTRIISSESELNSRWLQRGALNDSEFAQLEYSTDGIKSIPLYIDECKNSSLKYLINRIKQYAIVKKAKVFVVDYLQLVQHRMRGISREQEVAFIARALKNVAKELNVVVMALSQLNRGVGNREGGRPTMSDLRESGEIEQAADIVCLVYRPEYYNITADEVGNSLEGVVEIIFAKGRNIGTGTIVMEFQKELTKFKDKD